MSEQTTQKQAAETPRPAFNSGGEDRGFRRAPAFDKEGEQGPRSKGRRRRKVSYLTINKIEFVDYKEVNILRRFLNEHGKILPTRQSGNTAKQQRMIGAAIKRAREMALLPFVVTEFAQDRPMRPRYQRDGGRGDYNRGEYSRGGGEDRGPREERAPREENPPA